MMMVLMGKALTVEFTSEYQQSSLGVRLQYSAPLLVKLRADIVYILVNLYAVV